MAFCEAMEEAEMNPSEKLATSFKVIWFTCVGKGAIAMRRRTEYKSGNAALCQCHFMLLENYSLGASFSPG